MSDVVAGLKPELLWKHFAAISRIPRGSGNEAAVARYVRDVARGLGLEAETDPAGNVLVRKPASAGREDCRTVVLQGHLDMVCEKNAATRHDFLQDPIRLARDGNILTADGTTLGADNGVAVAAGLAVMQDRSIEHGPLEVLFTVEEETSLKGASNLSPRLLRGRVLLNLDSEEEGVLFVGCAGGRDTVGVWKTQLKEPPESFAAVWARVTGLRGGHSGMDIDKGRGNAIKIMNRVLQEFAATDVRLESIAGGDKHNAIPRECEALLWFPANRIAEVERRVNDLAAAIRAELGSADPNLSITLTPAGRLPAKEGSTGRVQRVLKRRDQNRLVRMLAALPHGVARMSCDIPGLVETSTNLAVIRSEGNAYRVVTFQRSSLDSALREVTASVEAIFELGDTHIQSSAAYPGWRPDLDSEILQIARAAWRDLSGKEPVVTAVHAGLECGVIGEKIPGMDMISFGPTMTGVHSPEEALHIDTVERFWNFLLEILKRVN